MSDQKVKVELTDLRSITRNADTCRTQVKLRNTSYSGDRENIPWLLYGMTDLRRHESNYDKIDRWWLMAYLTAGQTDYEHDSAYALRLPLIGVTFHSIFYHCISISGVVDPTDQDFYEEFHVPLPGYNPATEPCTTCKEPHMMVPEGLYVPPFNPELYALVAGREVVIDIDTPPPPKKESP